MSGGRGRLARALLVVGAVLVLVYLPLTWGQIVFFRDAAHWNYPARWFLRHAHAAGEGVAWNPFVGLGLPVRANPLYAPFYPPNWLYAVVPAAIVAPLVTWLAFAHVVWGSVGTALLARRLGAVGVGVIVAGLAWGLSGWTSSAHVAGLLLPAGAWVPWIALGLVGVVRVATDGGSWPRAVAAAAAPMALSWLHGEVFVTTMGVLLAIAVAGAVLVATTDPRARPWRPAVAGAAASVALASLVGAAVVLPARTLAAANERASALPRADAEACSMHPLRLLEMIVPGSMGAPSGDYPGARVIGEPKLGGHPLFQDVYLGATIVALASLALGRGRRVANALAACAAVAVVVAAGKHTPVHALVRTIVPPLAYMRYPEKYLTLVVPLVAVLAGLGTARALSGERARWRAGGTLAIVALAGAVAPLAFPAVWSPFVVRGAVHAGLALAALLAAAFLAVRRPRAAAGLLALAVAVDLGGQALVSLELDDSSVATHVPAAAVAIARDHEAHGGGPEPPRLYRSDALEPSMKRFVEASGFAPLERRSVDALIPNVGSTFGLAMVPGYDAAVPTALVELWKRALVRGFAVLRLFAVEYALLPIADPSDSADRRVGVQPMADPVPGARLYRVADPLPRVYLAGRGELADDAAASSRVFEAAVLDGGVALLAPGPGVTPVDGEAARAGRCATESFRDARVVARCHAERPAVAVFVEQHAPGWRAELDGAPAPLLRANLLMRAVPVPAGEHRIELTYETPAATTAGALSLAGVLGIALLALLPLLRRLKR